MKIIFNLDISKYQGCFADQNQRTYEHKNIDNHGVEY